MGPEFYCLSWEAVKKYQVVRLMLDVDHNINHWFLIVISILCGLCLCDSGTEGWLGVWVWVGVVGVGHGVLTLTL